MLFWNQEITNSNYIPIEVLFSLKQFLFCQCFFVVLLYFKLVYINSTHTKIRCMRIVLGIATWKWKRHTLYQKWSNNQPPKSFNLSQTEKGIWVRVGNLISIQALMVKWVTNCHFIGSPNRHKPNPSQLFLLFLFCYSFSCVKLCPQNLSTNLSQLDTQTSPGSPLKKLKPPSIFSSPL